MTGFLRITKLDLFTMKSQLVMYLSLALVVMMFGLMGSSVTILKESIRFRADKESSFIQKIKLL